MKNPQNDGQSPKKSRRSALNILPKEMKNYLNALVEQGLGERTIKKAMLHQFPDRPDLVDKSENRCRHYINLNKQILADVSNSPNLSIKP